MLQTLEGLLSTVSSEVQIGSITCPEDIAGVSLLVALYSASA